MIDGMENFAAKISSEKRERNSRAEGDYLRSCYTLSGFLRLLYKSQHVA